MPLNEFGQPIGDALPDWTGRTAPDHGTLTGRYTTLCALDPSMHGDDLFAAFTDPAMWTYMPVGPFADRTAFDAFLAGIKHSTDPLFYAIIDPASGRAMGFASYLRIEPAVGAIEVGYITMSPALQKTRIATEAMYLMMAHAFDDLGYRRYEWKCDNLNGPSKRAAQRFGFTYDGMFPQATVYKGRNRDTAWFSIVDGDWARVKAGFEAWLDPANFDSGAMQKSRLMTQG